MFWVTDNFLMRKTGQYKDSSLLNKVKVKYQRIRLAKNEAEDLEGLVSGSSDEQLLGTEIVGTSMHRDGFAFT